MALNVTLGKKAFLTGEYYLLDIDSVLECYKKAGYDIDNEDEEVPNVLTIDGSECFFTGDLVKRGETYYEIVIAAKDFTWDEVESEDFDEEFDDEE